MDAKFRFPLFYSKLRAEIKRSASLITAVVDSLSSKGEAFEVSLPSIWLCSERTRVEDCGFCDTRCKAEQVVLLVESWLLRNLLCTKTFIKQRSLKSSLSFGHIKNGSSHPQSA